MLNDDEIDDYYASVKSYFISQNEYKVSMQENWLRTNILMNNENRIMGIAKYPMSIRSLAGLKYYPVYSFYLANQEKYDWIEKNKSWKYSKDSNAYQWVTTLPIKSIDDLKEYVLMNQKVALMDKIHEMIEFKRNQQSSVLLGQESIYISKYLEARYVIDNNVSEDRLLDFPFVSGYAQTRGISLQQSAKEIELQYQIKSGALAESENLRIKYTHIVKNETDIVNLKQIFEDFQDETMKYANL
jgi:hypothetical protein